MSKKQTRKKGVDSQAVTFQNLQQLYGLRRPKHIKLKIIWHHLQALIKAQYAGADTEQQLKRYNLHWRVCEAEENKN